MAARLSRAPLAAFLLLLLGAAPVAAGLPPGAGLARAVAGQWAAAADRLEALPAAGRGRAEQYFYAAAQLQLGLRGPGLAGLRELSDTGGPFSGPALELAVQTLFAEGRYAEVAEWVAASPTERFQDADSLHYRVGQSHLLLGHPEDARRSLERVANGVLLPYALHSRALLEVAARRFGPAVDRLGDAITAAEIAPQPEVAAALGDTLRITRGRVLYQLAANASALAEQERVRLAGLAREQFERVPEASALYPEALRGIGWCTLESGDSSRALASFAAAGGMDPAGRAEDLWAQGRVYQRLGYYDEAARFYREAAESAVEIAAQVATESGFGAAPVPAAARWERRGSMAGTLEAGLGNLAAPLATLAGAAAARDRRLEVAAQVIEARRLRVSELQDELATLTAQLQEFLDQISAAALFPPGERGRVRSLGALQQSLDDDVTRIENALGAIGNTVFWTEASTEQRARGQALWARLGRAKETLGDLQLGFLLALKQRVSQRETELARQIERMQQDSRALAGPLAAADQARLAAVSRSAALGGRLAALRQRFGALREPLGELRAAAGEQVARAESQARAEQVEQLRLRADAYALDEAQALHLVQERPR
ncbi:MAG: hypothetical protein P1P84_02370 [Deferrisomatales bacterium]|nr:hypothetical protein [Deferrisomatales bacterium]